jgi:iron complex transport system ATP-binding protein
MSVIAAGSLTGVTVQTGNQLRLHETTLHIPAGQVTAIFGRNGSGKSTLLGLLAGELTPSTGAASIDGVPIDTLSHRELARRRAILTQETQVSFGFTVRDVVSWGRTPWRGTSDADDAAIIDRAIEQQGLADIRDRPVTALSGGERKRVHIARVIAQQSPLLLLDEADADLDLVGRRTLDELVTGHVRSGGTAVVVSHDLTRMAHVCGHVVLMRAGRVHAAGPRADLLTQELLSEAYDADVRVIGVGNEMSIRIP